MIPFDEAVARVREVARLIGSESVPLDRAARRVLLDRVTARIDSPRANSSAMDGYAVREADFRQSPARLEVVGEAYPGAACAARVEPGTCVRIFTGAALPPGADRIVIQENVRRDGNFAIFDADLGPERHIRGRGSDFIRGALLIEPGRLLGPTALVAAAAGDVSQLMVAVRPRIAILSTGDELAAPGIASQSEYKVPESVSLAIAALAEFWGGEVMCRKLLNDELDAMKAAAADALSSADLVIVTGGASVGDRDYAKAMFQDEDMRLVFSRVLMKPGKPAWLGSARGRVVLGLPGNPTSALVTARLFLAPLLCGMTGRDFGESLNWRHAPVAETLGSTGNRETFLRASWDGSSARPLGNQQSHVQGALARADVLIRRRIGAPAVAAGELVEVIEL